MIVPLCKKCVGLQFGGLPFRFAGLQSGFRSMHPIIDRQETGMTAGQEPGRRRISSRTGELGGPFVNYDMAKDLLVFCVTE